MANGHPDAGDYVIAKVWDEVALVVERKNADWVTLASIMQAATATTGMTACRENSQRFKKLLDRLMNGE